MCFYNFVFLSFLAALKLLKSELDVQYGEIKQICCMETAKHYLNQTKESDLMEIVRSLNLTLPAAAKSNSGEGSSTMLQTTRGVYGGTVSTDSQAVQNVASLLDKMKPDKVKHYGVIQLQYARYVDGKN